MRGLRIFLCGIAIAVASLGIGSPKMPQVVSIKISGDVDHAGKITADEIAKMPHSTVTLTEKDGSQTSYSGVPLVEILRIHHVITGEHVMGKGLATYLSAIAKDGYQVVFGLGELDPGVSDRTIILADSMGGQPLNDKLGPFRICVGGDKKQARCIRMVTELHIVKLRR
jgi:hypothetical protein